jgi:hypothetical protein
MKYTENSNTITLEMSFDDYRTLLVMLGTAVGTAQMTVQISGNALLFWRWVDFTNRMNAGNPNFTPYDIPDEYRRQADV